MKVALQSPHSQLFFIGSNTLSHHTHSLYHGIMVNMVETRLSLVDHVSGRNIMTFECSA